MSSISIEAARATYGGSDLGETLANMAATVGCTRIYAFANDFGDKKAPTDFFRIERDGDEEQFCASKTVHNARLVYDHGVLDLRVFDAPTHRSFAQILERTPIFLRETWAYNGPLIIAIVLLLAAWGLISFSFMQEEFRQAAHFELPEPKVTAGMVLEYLGIGLLPILFGSIISVPVAAWIADKFFEYTDGAGLIIYSSLNLALGLAAILFG